MSASTPSYTTTAGYPPQNQGYPSYPPQGYHAPGQSGPGPGPGPYPNYSPPPNQAYPAPIPGPQPAYYPSAQQQPQLQPLPQPQPQPQLQPQPGPPPFVQEKSSYPSPTAQPQLPYGAPPLVAQQPVATLPMGFNTRNAKNMPFDRAGGTRDWSFGLCDCTEDCGTCCLAGFCPCMIYASNKSRFDHLNNTQVPHPSGGDSCSGDCFLHGFLVFCGVGWALQMSTRGIVRARYAIGGDGCTDCLAAHYCTPCQLTQESLEIAQEENAIRNGPANWGKA